MNDFFEFMDISYFSCDINKSSLVISEKNGNLKFIGNSISEFNPDHFKKFVCFFPVDDYAFTTSDSGLGLRVWDREKEVEVYRYQQDNLGIHKYSSNKIIGALSPLGVKIYDIRSRYHISSCSLPLSLGLNWDSENLIIFSESSIFKYDLKREKYQEIVKDKGISEVLISKGQIYYIKNSDSKYFLIKEGLNYEIETVGKNGNVLEDDTIYVYGNNEVKFYNEKTKLMDFKFIKSINDLRYTKYNTYLFGDRKLYVKEGRYCYE